MGLFIASKILDTVRSRIRHDVARLTVLRKMGLAESIGPYTWRVRRDFEQVLRAMQRTADRQRTLAAHGTLMSDKRLPIEVLDLTQATSVEGRVLVHGQDEQTGRSYLMLEGTDAKVHFIQYTREMEEARSRGELGANSFVRMKKRLWGGAPVMDISDLGDADRLLTNPHHMGDAACQLLQRGVVPTEDGWGGWLGKYQAAVCNTVRKIDEPKERNRVRTKERRRDRSRGR